MRHLIFAIFALASIWIGTALPAHAKSIHHNVKIDINDVSVVKVNDDTTNSFVLKICGLDELKISGLPSLHYKKIFFALPPNVHNLNLENINFSNPYIVDVPGTLFRSPVDVKLKGLNTDDGSYCNKINHSVEFFKGINTIGTVEVYPISYDEKANKDTTDSHFIFFPYDKYEPTNAANIARNVVVANEEHEYTPLLLDGKIWRYGALNETIRDGGNNPLGLSEYEFGYYLYGDTIVNDIPYAKLYY